MTGGDSLHAGIEAQAITKTYRHGVKALRGVSFTVAWGQVFAYLGRNGSGKTTTIRVLTTLTRLSSGRAAVAGHDVTASPASVRRAIGVTMQEAALDEMMTGREHLQLVGRLWGESKSHADRRAKELLELFDLVEARDRRVVTYSGGMRRRLDVASALFRRPPVLFLDEPTTGLDPQSRRAVWAMIQTARDDGAAVFLTTQYIEEADRLADVVAIISAGEIRATGRTAQLKASLAGRALKLRVPEERVQQLKGLMPERQLDDLGGGWVRVKLDDSASTGDAVLDIVGRVNRRGIPVENLTVAEPSLEDAFIHLTAEETDPASARPGLIGG